MAKKKKAGRPKGSDKEAVNIYMLKDTAKKLRELAFNEQKTISVMVGNALRDQYSI